MKERYQNPVLNDEIRLRLFSYNSNNRASIDTIERVEIYYLDEVEKSASNPDGRRLITSITEITEEEVGLYSVLVDADEDLFSIGNYIDIWKCNISGQSADIENNFQIYPDLWFTTTTPIIYDYNFSFRPNSLRKGSKRYLAIEIAPNVVNRDDLHAYYQNIAIASPLKISIQQQCGPCVPVEEDLRMVVEEADVELREKCFGYYFLDTSEMDAGIYDVWFTMEIGESVYVSEKQQFQVI